MSDGLEASAVRVRIPLRAAFVSGGGTWRDVDAWIVRLRDVDGHAGVGEATLGPGATLAELDRLATLVRGLVARSWVPLESLVMPAGYAPRDRCARAAQAAIDGALLDLGRAPLPGPAGGSWPGPAGGSPLSVPVNAVIAVEGAEETLAAVRRAVDRGFSTLKLKVGSEATTAALVERVACVRAAVGTAVALRLDVNGAWDRGQARERLVALAGWGLEFVEQPIPVGSPGDLARLRADVPVPIAADEAVTDVDAAQRLLDARAVDVLVVKLARVGGQTAALDIAARAAAAGVAVVISTLLETGVGLAAGLSVAARLPRTGEPLAHGLATADMLASDLLIKPLAITGGRMTVPSVDSTAEAIDAGALSRHAVEWAGAPW